MGNSLKTFIVGSTLLASFASFANVGSWNLNRLISSPVPGVDEAIIGKLKAAIKANCADLSESDTVTLKTQTVLHTDYYPLGGSYQPLDYSKFIFERSGNGQSYSIEAETSWDYDLPMPMVYVAIKDLPGCSTR